MPPYPAYIMQQTLCKACYVKLHNHVQEQAAFHAQNLHRLAVAIGDSTVLGEPGASDKLNDAAEFVGRIASVAYPRVNPPPPPYDPSRRDVPFHKRNRGHA